MTDRTKIADALERMAVEAEDGYSIPAGPSEVTTFRDAARVLRADPDTSDEWSAQPQPATLVTEQPDGSVTRTQVQRVSLREVYDPDTSDDEWCQRCNDEGVVCTHDGDIIGPCDCTSDDLASEARRLLDAATPGPWERPSSTANWFTVPQPIQIDEADWGQETQEGGALCGYRIGSLADDRAWRYADVELIAAAPRLIAALLERAVTAEAEARQLREAIEIQAERPIPTLPSRWTEDEKVSYRSGWLDRTEHMRDALTFWDAPAAVAEGAEDAEDTE